VLQLEKSTRLLAMKVERMMNDFMVATLGNALPNRDGVKPHRHPSRTDSTNAEVGFLPIDSTHFRPMLDDENEPGPTQGFFPELANPDLLITANHSKADATALSRSYCSALKLHLDRNPESDLSVARKLGRRASRLGVNTLELARIHEAAVLSLEISGASTRSKPAHSRRAMVFFHTALSPIEENHCEESSKGRHKTTINTLTRRTRDLAASNAKLRKEITRRKAVEKSLRTSETTTSRLLKKSRELQEEMRFLSRRLLDVQENERRRISRELHDVIAQTLAGINVRLAVLRSMTTASATDFNEKIQVTERLVEESVDIVYRFASDLRPLVLDDLGLIPALQTYTKAFTRHSGIPVKMTALTAIESLESSSRTTLFRIAQEALANILRHSKASEVKIDLRNAKGGVRMTISDNGRGFTEKSTDTRSGTRLGLLGMRERAGMIGGSCLVESTPGMGTTLRVEVPRNPTTSAIVFENSTKLP